MPKDANSLSQAGDIFEVTVPGKWILAGEHAVLRGAEALVFPLFSKYLKLSYRKHEEDLDLVIEGENASDLELIVWAVIERALKNLNIRRRDLKGTLSFESKIALGGGTGASATLCVALTHWLSYLGYVGKDDRFVFARELENIFHGESSGVDVAVTLHQKPLVFTRTQGMTELHVKNKVNLYLSYSGQRGVTKDCVDKVKTLFVENPDLAKSLDLQMQESVDSFKNLLSDKHTLIDWIKAIKKSNACFEQWGLVTESVKQHQKTLLDHGALAVKLTGSGGGGYVLSLWEGEPSVKLPFEMIACFPQ